jgi:hypothetical protein
MRIRAMLEVLAPEERACFVEAVAKISMLGLHAALFLLFLTCLIIVLVIALRLSTQERTQT